MIQCTYYSLFKDKARAHVGLLAENGHRGHPPAHKLIPSSDIAVVPTAESSSTPQTHHALFDTVFEALGPGAFVGPLFPCVSGF